MQILNKWLNLILLLMWHLTVCSSQNEAIRHLNLKFNRLNRLSNGLQRDVDDIWTALSNIVVRNSGQVNQDNNETEPENPNSEEVLKLVNGTVSEVKELKAEVEELMVYAQNGLKHEKAFSHKILNEIQTSQTDHEAITSNDIAEMKILLQNLDQKQRLTLDLEAKFLNFKTKTETVDRNLLEKIQNKINKCEAKLDENELEIQVLNDKLEREKQNLKISMESYVTDAVALVGQKILEKLGDAITCDVPWELFGNSCYLLGSKQMAWEDASEHCSSMGSHLLEVDNADERDFLVQKYKAKYTVWVGGNDKETEGTFVWQASKKMIPTDSFYLGEPNGGRNENCAELYCQSARVSKLNDRNCRDKRNYICEKSKYIF